MILSPSILKSSTHRYGHRTDELAVTSTNNAQRQWPQFDSSTSNQVDYSVVFGEQLHHRQRRGRSACQPGLWGKCRRGSSWSVDGLPGMGAQWGAEVAETPSHRQHLPGRHPGQHAVEPRQWGGWLHGAGSGLWETNTVVQITGSREAQRG
jgi:hypothetical protein